jgi:hypothetical protein
LDCAELRSHAQVNVWLAKENNWPFPDMAQFFIDDPNGDPHLELAADALGISREEAALRKKSGDKQIKRTRQGKKPSNFGLPGGMGVEKLQESARKSYGVRMTIKESRAEIAGWKKRWREMPRYLAWIAERTQTPHEVVQFVSKRIRSQCGYTADATKHALWMVAQECYLEELGSPLFGSRIVLFLYDELILEVPIDCSSAAGKRLAEVIIAAVSEYLPDIPTTASPALMTKWIKGAEPKYAVDGDPTSDLIPWA